MYLIFRIDPKVISSSTTLTRSDLSLSLLKQAASMFSIDFWKRMDNKGSDPNNLSLDTLSSKSDIALAPSGSLSIETAEIEAKANGNICASGLLSVANLCIESPSAPVSSTHQPGVMTAGGRKPQQGLMVRGVNRDLAEGGKGMGDVDVGLNTVMFMKRFVRWCQHNAVIHRSKAIDSTPPSNVSPPTYACLTLPISSCTSPSLFDAGLSVPGTELIADSLSSSKLTRPLSYSHSAKSSYLADDAGNVMIRAVSCDDSASAEHRQRTNSTKLSPPQRPTSLRLKNVTSLTLSTDNFAGEHYK